jgi:hypothetical protein
VPGKSRSTSTTVTVASEVVKTGIEIQFPSSLNGKQLIAHGAISTVLGMWWTGPAVHGGLWTKGRCTWNNIDSSKKYAIQTGDACESSLPRETPSVCAGTFADGDDVVILVRNPGFDFRVYGSGNVHKLSGTSFSVLYLDETSGDIITTAFTGKVCGWLGIPSGTECDAFWAEFYDPIFVANYMSIASTGNDMFGNPRTLSWIDHVAFVASLVGSLPVFNLFPFAGITKNLKTGIKVIIDKTLSITDLLSAELQECGRAMADICMNAPKVIKDLLPDELARLREAMVKVFGEIDGNKYVDDALAVTSAVFDEAYAIISKGTVTIQELAKFDTLLTNNPELGAELGARYKEVLLGRPPHPASPTVEDLNAIRNHARSIHTKDVIQVWANSNFANRGLLGEHSRLYQLMNRDYAKLKEAFGEHRAVTWVRSQGNIADSVAHAPVPADADKVARAMSDFVWDWETVAKSMGKSDAEMVGDYLICADTLETTAVDLWRGEATDFTITHIDEAIDTLITKPVADNAPMLLNAWSPTPTALPATISPIPTCKPWFSDFTVLDSFAKMVDDAAKSTMGLAGGDLTRAGESLRTICDDASSVVKTMDNVEVANFRSALVKIYGDVDGNKYVDDALRAASEFVKKYYDILEAFRTGAADLPSDAVGTILNRGQETPNEIIDLIIEFESKGTIDGLCDKLALEAAEYPMGSTFRTLSSKRGLVDEATLPKFTKNHCNVAEKATAAADPIKTMEIPETAQELPFEFRPIADEVGEPISTNLNEVIEKFAESDTGQWRQTGIRYIDRKILGWFNKITSKKQKEIRFPDAPGRYAKWKNIYDNLEDWQKFTTMTMLAWGCYEVASFFGGYVIPKILGVFPEQASWRQIRHNENMESFAWMCKAAHDEGRTDDLKEAIGLLRNEIAEAEKHLADNATEFKISKVYNGFLNALEGAKLTLSIAEGWLVEMVPVGYIRCTSNEAFFYVDLDGSPAGFSYANKEILLSSVPVGNHVVKIHKSGSGECEKTITVGEGITSEFYCQLGIVCTPPVPSITAPGKAKVKEGVRFTGSATTESAITYWHWDFDDGTDSHVQSPSHLFWSAGTYTVKLTVTDDCGTAETTHTIVIEGEAPIPPIPPIIPPEEEAATIDVKTPIDARTGGAIVFPIKPYIFVDGKSIDETAPYPIPFGGFGELPVKDPTTVTVKAAGYQDKSETFHLTDKYFESWVPYMDPVGYVPPVGHPIDFYIPENASLTVTPITTVSRLVAGIRSIGRR